MIVPPIKSQGIKTKLVPWILDVIDKSGIDLLILIGSSLFSAQVLSDLILLYQESI